MMNVIRTLLGDIPAESIGNTDAHDHLIRSGGPEVDRDPGFLMDDIDAANREFGSFLDAGGKTMICMDPIGCGRNVPKMLEIAERWKGRGNLVMVTGFHKAANYDKRTSFLATVPAEQIAELTTLEITEGMDRYSYNGPIVERMPCKAGLIKAGTSYRLITPLEQKALRIATMTQKNTGCAISVHTEFGTMGLEILRLIRAEGGNPEKTVLCHVQRNPDKIYYQKILDQGAVLCIEEADKPQLRPDTELARILSELIELGYRDQILLGMDGGRREALRAYMEPEGIAPGLDYLFTSFVPLLKSCGIAQENIDKMLVANPARVFSLAV